MNDAAGKSPGVDAARPMAGTIDPTHPSTSGFIAKDA